MIYTFWHWMDYHYGFEYALAHWWEVVVEN